MWCLGKEESGMGIQSLIKGLMGLGASRAPRQGSECDPHDAGEGVVDGMD